MRHLWGNTDDHNVVLFHKCLYTFSGVLPSCIQDESDRAVFFTATCRSNEDEFLKPPLECVRVLKVGRWLVVLPDAGMFLHLRVNSIRLSFPNHLQGNDFSICGGGRRHGEPKSEVPQRNSGLR